MTQSKKTNIFILQLQQRRDPEFIFFSHYNQTGKIWENVIKAHTQKKWLFCVCIVLFNSVLYWSENIFQKKHWKIFCSNKKSFLSLQPLSTRSIHLRQVGGSKQKRSLDYFHTRFYDNKSNAKYLFLIFQGLIFRLPVQFSNTNK